MSSEKPPIIGFTLKAEKKVECGAVGDTLSFFYQHGLEPCEVTPIFGDRLGAPVALPAPRSGKIDRNVILKLMMEIGQPMRPRDLFVHLTKRGLGAPQSLRQTLVNMTKGKLLKKTPKGLYSIRAGYIGIKAARKQSGRETQEQLALRLIKSGINTTRQLAAEFGKAGFSPMSTGSVLHTMINKRKLIKRIAPQTYQAT